MHHQASPQTTGRRTRHSTLIPAGNQERRRQSVDRGTTSPSPPRLSVLQQRVTVRQNSNEDNDSAPKVSRTRSKTRKGIEFSIDTKHGSSSHGHSSHSHHHHHRHYNISGSGGEGFDIVESKRRDQFGLMRLDRRQRHLLDVISQWMNKTTQVRTVTLARSFNNWKYSVLVAAPRSGSGNSDDLSSPIQTEYRSLIGEQKNSYLLLFAENEKLREQLEEMRRNTTKNEGQTRAAAMRAVVKIILRSRQTNKLRYYYDLWLNNSKMISLVSNSSQRSMQLEVGLQALESERAYVSNIEELNSKLMLSLSLTVFFYKWKSRTANMILLEERSVYDKQKRVIFNELLRIKNIVSRANKQEAALMAAAVRRGTELSGSLSDLHEQFVGIFEVNQATRENNNSNNNNNNSNDNYNSSSNKNKTALVNN